jgi:hypothetical protein
MTTVFYTYLYLSEDGQPYYVGKGDRNRVFSSKHRVPVPSADRILLEPHTSEEDALAAEMFLLAYYGRQDKGTGCLLNKSAGRKPIANYEADVMPHVGFSGSGGNSGGSCRRDWCRVTGNHSTIR